MCVVFNPLLCGQRVGPSHAPVLREGMKVDDELRALIKSKREALSLSQHALASAAGTTQQTVDRIERGVTSFSRTVPAILRALDIKPGLARSRLVPAQSGDPIPASELLGGRDLPVYGAAQGGQGAMILTVDPVQRVRRPEHLVGVDDGYGIFVVGDSMQPAFWHGDIALIHPHKPLRSGDDIVLYGSDSGGNDVAVIKHLRRFDDELWHLRQWNPTGDDPQDFTLDRKLWPIGHNVVGRYARP